jgi:hypothetical protein
MAGKGKKLTFHGAFTLKRKAQAKERKVGGFIRQIKVRGQRRYAVLKRSKG